MNYAKATLFLYLYLSCVFPSVFSIFKYFLLGVLVLYSATCLLSRPLRRINYVLILVVLFFLVYLLFSSFLSLWNGYDFYFGQFRNTFLNVLTVSLIVFAFSRAVDFQEINRLIIVSGISICLLLAVFSVSVYLWQKAIISTPLNYGHLFGGIVIEDSKIQIRSIAQTSLIFIAPYISMYFILSGKLSEPRWFFGFMILFVVVLVSGRRALQLSFFLSFLLVMFHIRNAIFGKFLFFLFGTIFLFFAFVHSSAVEIEFIDSVINTFLDGFDTSSNSAGLKLEQFYPLIEHWSNSVLFGSGLFSYPSSYVRSTDSPYSFELVFLALLSQIGLFGFLCILFVFFVYLWRGFAALSVIRDRRGRAHFLALSYAAGLFFVMAGTNPMLYFSWFWIYLILGGGLGVRRSGGSFE